MARLIDRSNTSLDPHGVIWVMPLGADTLEELQELRDFADETDDQRIPLQRSGTLRDGETD